MPCISTHKRHTSSSFLTFNKISQASVSSWLQVTSNTDSVGTLLAHLSRRGLQDRQSSVVVRRRPSIVRPSTISKKNISEASRPILIKFNVNHNWVGGLMALGFGADCIKIVVSMATDRSHRLTMGKTKKIFFSETTRPTALIFGM